MAVSAGGAERAEQASAAGACSADIDMQAAGACSSQPPASQPGSSRQQQQEARQADGGRALAILFLRPEYKSKSFFACKGTREPVSIETAAKAHHPEVAQRFVSRRAVATKIIDGPKYLNEHLRLAVKVNGRAVVVEVLVDSHDLVHQDAHGGKRVLQGGAVWVEALTSRTDNEEVERKHRSLLQRQRQKAKAGVMMSQLQRKLGR